MSILIDETTKRVALQAEDHRVARVAQASRIFVREIAQLRKQLVEALEEQTATSEVLRIISNSPNEIQPALDAERKPTNSALFARHREISVVWDYVVGLGDVPCWAGSNTYAGCG
jgi:hypothetical protein